ncbi:hypothetical protein GYMLUDRAFT_253664 [Collybiopsis luxurians FD-317 M1]|uniref:Uncharacterized protein n=1 Tax=Collybiopsis luxurians FD-317 M1 TaxID=944289 RepID=A0A0D0B6L2_9AGAR|nr:hypothetical protein GYMLUDRAFT_253664 [Collybiopsis luxurians FD-317 M1]
MRDITKEKFFDRHFTVDDIDRAKELLKELHPSCSTTGEDDIHYHDIQQMESQLIANIWEFSRKTKVSMILVDIEWLCWRVAC